MTPVTLPILSALVDKSLLRRMSEGRYDMHQMVRQYALVYLQSYTEESNQVCRSHFSYYLAWLHNQEVSLKSAKQQVALVEFRQENDNIRLAWDWAISHHHIQEIGQAVASLGILFDIEGRFQEAATLFQRAVEHLKATVTEVDSEYSLLIGQLLGELGWFYYRCNQLEQAKAILEEGIARLRPFYLQIELSDSLRYLGTVAISAGAYAQAVGALEESDMVAQANHDVWRSALAKATSGVLVQTLGDYQEAQHRLREALAIYRAVGDQRLVSIY